MAKVNKDAAHTKKVAARQDRAKIKKRRRQDGGVEQGPCSQAGPTKKKAKGCHRAKAATMRKRANRRTPGGAPSFTVTLPEGKGK